MSDLRQQPVGHLDIAGVRVGEPTHLTTAERVEGVDADCHAVEQALATPRFDEQRVLKGPQINDDIGSQWRIDTRDDDTRSLASDETE